MKNSTKGKKGFLLLFVAWLAFGPPVSGQLHAQTTTLPGTLPSGSGGTASGKEIDDQIDKLLGVKSGEIMGGMEGYGLDIGEAIKGMILDKVMIAVANSVVLAPAATAILDAYETVKKNNLSDKIKETKKEIQKDLDASLKMRYQRYKVNYETAQVEQKMTEGFKKSGAYQTYESAKTALAQQKTEVNSALSRYSAMGVNTSAYRSELTRLAAQDEQQAKREVATQEYASGDSSPVVGLSAYERMQLRRGAARTSTLNAVRMSRLNREAFGKAAEISYQKSRAEQIKNMKAGRRL